MNWVKNILIKFWTFGYGFVLRKFKKVKAHYGDSFYVVTLYYFFKWSFLNLNYVKNAKRIHNVFAYYCNAQIQKNN
jgi:hypothetical protein